MLYVQMALEPPILGIDTDEEHLKLVAEYKKVLISKAKENPDQRNILIAIVKEAESLGILCSV